MSSGTARSRWGAIVDPRAAAIRSAARTPRCRSRVVFWVRTVFARGSPVGHRIREGQRAAEAGPRGIVPVGGFVFGSSRISAPAALRMYSNAVDARNQDGTPLRVNVSGNLDLDSGKVTWIFDSIDPATGGPPEDPDAGFLPVNDANHRGEGHVSFVVKPRSSLADGVEITNEAEIKFDSNSPIFTPKTQNNIGPPPGPAGDANGDEPVNAADIFYLTNHLFAGGALPAGNGDANGDGDVGVGVYLINHLFAGGPAPG